MRNGPIPVTAADWEAWEAGQWPPPPPKMIRPVTGADWEQWRREQR